MKYQYKIRTFPNGNQFYIFRFFDFKTRESFERSEFSSLPDWLDFDTLDDLSDYIWDDVPHSRRAAEHCKAVSLQRTKKTVREYCMCNVWDWFGTLTLDSHKIDRFDFDKIMKTVRKFFNHLKEDFPDFKYLAIPEKHKNGAWHLHVLFSGLPENLFVDSGVVQDGKIVFNFTKYRLGFNNFTKVENTQKVSNYILKYITKSLIDMPCRQRYYCSQGLLKPTEEIYEFECEHLDFFEMEKVIKNDGKDIGWLNSSHNFDDYFYFAVQ